MNQGAELWQRAKRIIPGGNQLLSKRAEMFLPDHWPAYYERAKGVEIWDLDENHYFDMSIMGIGSCVLGYAHPVVTRAVHRAVDQGSMCTLNCHEEVALAEKLLALHPWAESVRFARTGGEACAIAMRIARAASGKDKVAFCGYHGWGDWYLAANIANAKHLDGQLLPGLDPAGVPRVLEGTAIPFDYGDLNALKTIVKANAGEIGVIMMEVERHQPIDIDFLRGARETASRIGAVLVFDEVSSGFRVNIGGLHLLHDIEPDMLVLGKALGNGHPIATVLGRRQVMDAAQATFISSTYWTERVGFAAALATIEVFETDNVVAHMADIGNYARTGLKKIFAETGLDIAIVGMAPVPILVIKDEHAPLIKTAFTQEMLKRGFLASTVLYICQAHTREIVDRYLREAGEVLSGIADAKRSGTLEGMLEGPVCHTGFRRLA
jgi:glutamate-1-semialdehyde 2,1-aminomutase